MTIIVAAEYERKLLKETDTDQNKGGEWLKAGNCLWLQMIVTDCDGKMRQTWE